MTNNKMKMKKENTSTPIPINSELNELAKQMPAMAEEFQRFTLAYSCSTQPTPRARKSKYKGDGDIGTPIV